MSFKSFFRSVGHILAFPYIITTLWISIQISKKKAKDYKNNPDYYPIEDRYTSVYKMIKKTFFLLNTKIIYSGFENVSKRPVLFVPNHKSNIDPLIFIKILYENAGYPFFNFVAKKEILDNPLASGASILIDSLILDRENPREIIKILSKEEEMIKKNSFVVFLEGTRIEDHTIGEIKSAGLIPAINNLVTIIPVCIYGTIGVLKSKEKNRFRYKEFHVKFLKPIKHSDYAGKNKEILAENIRESLEKEYLSIKKKLENVPNE